AGCVDRKRHACAAWRSKFASTDFGERLARDSDAFVDHCVDMCRRHEAGLECRWRQINAFVEHRMEEGIEALFVARHHLLVIDRYFGSEIESEHAAYRCRAESHAGVFRRLAEAIGQTTRGCAECVVEA